MSIDTQPQEISPSQLNNSPADSYRGFNLIYLSLLYGCGAFTLNLAPVILGSLMEHLELSKANAGLIITLEIVSMGIASVFLANHLRRISLHRLLLWVLSGLICFNLLSAAIENLYALGVLRSLAGLCSGALLAITLYLIAHSTDHVRLLGLALTGSLLSGSAFLAFTPTAVEQWQLPGLFVTAAFLPFVLLVLLSRFQLIKESTTGGDEVKENNLPRLTAVGYLFIAAVLAIHIAQGGYYSFIEVLGTEIALEKTTIGFTLSLSYLLALTGSLTASAVGNRFGLTLPLLIGMVGQSTAVATAVFTSDHNYFMAAVCLQSFFYFLFTPYLLGAANKIDPSGKLSAVGMGVIITGLGFAPLIYGLILSHFSSLFIAWAMVSSAIFSFIALQITLKSE
ncbi:MAG: MFS transporter [Cellvibrionaceae bacterium]